MTLVPRATLADGAPRIAGACYHAWMNTWSADLLTVSSIESRCASCGHPEWAHVLEDVPRALEKRCLCTECDDWHEFTDLTAAQVQQA
jgi:hypothetical protein